MGLTLHPRLENEIRALAESQGVSVEALLERLIRVSEADEQELINMALEGLNSGAAVETGPEYWQEKHTMLDQRVNATRRP